MEEGAGKWCSECALTSDCEEGTEPTSSGYQPITLPPGQTGSRLMPPQLWPFPSACGVSHNEVRVAASVSVEHARTGSGRCEIHFDSGGHFSLEEFLSCRDTLLASRSQELAQQGAELSVNSPASQLHPSPTLPSSPFPTHPTPLRPLHPPTHQPPRPPHRQTHGHARTLNQRVHQFN